MPTEHLMPIGSRECVTLKPKSLTRHAFFSNKFDTTAWNDFTRDPRDAGWLESRRHDGSRNQMYFMRKVPRIKVQRHVAPFMSQSSEQESENKLDLQDRLWFGAGTIILLHPTIETIHVATRCRGVYRSSLPTHLSSVANVLHVREMWQTPKEAVVLRSLLWAKNSPFHPITPKLLSS